MIHRPINILQTLSTVPDISNGTVRATGACSCHKGKNRTCPYEEFEHIPSLQQVSLHETETYGINSMHLVSPFFNTKLI